MADAQTYPVDVNDGLPYALNIAVPIGDSYRKPWALQRDTGTAAAVNLTGVTWTLIISTARNGPVKLSKTITTDWTASGIYIDSAAAGQFTVYVLAADVTALGVGPWYYEVEATFGASHADFPSMVKTLFRGTFNVTEDA